MKKILSIIGLSLAFISFSVKAAPNTPELAYMIKDAKASQCEVHTKQAKIVKGQIEGLGEVTVIALPMEGCGGGNNWGTTIQAFYQGKHTDSTGGAVIDNISIIDNKIVVKSTERGDNDPDCCPSQHVKTTYVINSGKLVQIK